MMLVDVPQVNWATVAYAAVLGIPGLLSYLKSRQNGQKADVADKKQDQLVQKATEIHSQTNGNLTRLTTELEASNKRIAALEGLVNTLVEKKTIARKRPSGKVTLEAGEGGT